MTDKMIWPLGDMREKSRQIGTGTENLANEHFGRLQKIQETNTSLPASMQETFDSFHNLLSQHMAGTIALRYTIGKGLTTAADLAEETDTGVSKGFQSNKQA